MKEMRLDKFLCQCLGISRKEAKDMIRKKQITVNGQQASRPEIKVFPGKDQVYCQEEALSYEEHHYLMLHKPQGVVSATKDASDKTVIDLIHENYKSGLFPVGRLDKDTEGLMLLTDDGELAHRLMAPKRHVPKSYYAEVAGRMGEAEVEAFSGHLDIGGGETAKPGILKILETSDERSKVIITISEGKFHQVKRMVSAVGSRVLYLKRVSIGPLELDEGLALGEYRELTKDEIDQIKEQRC